MKPFVKLLAAALPAVLGLSPTSAGVVVLSPEAILGDHASYSNSFPVEDMIDGDGLSVSFTSGVTDFATFMAGSPATQNSVGWFSPDDTAKPYSLDFDLGAIYDVSQLVVWLYNASGSTTTSSANSFEFSLSSQPDFINATDLGSFNIAANTAAANLFTLDENATGRYLRMEILGTFAGTDPGIIGIAEFAVGATSAIPEPTTAGVWLGALAFGLVATRRTQRT